MPKKIAADLPDLVGAMAASYREHKAIINIEAVSQINKDTIIEMINTFQILMFPGFFGKKRFKCSAMEYYIGELLEDISYHLQKQIVRARRNGCSEEEARREAETVTNEFLLRLPAIRALLATDVDASFDGDPAASNKEEIILSYPSIYAIMVNRLAHELYLLQVPLIPRLMTEHAHSLTGIDMHPGAALGHHFFIDHGTGIVVGETTVIGDYVKIYQGVTLGALSTRGGQALRHVKRHPTIEDKVTIYSGASIFGGETVIGEGSVIGSNAFITRSVPPCTKVNIVNPEHRFINEADCADF
ncbi:MAG: serine acetyltransferase [Gracilibacteraceae bacterium]|jgi:serine O-acetyltransferase|nr:serine acetyltransferase [Gracilibacteraceae bacterium]